MKIFSSIWFLFVIQRQCTKLLIMLTYISRWIERMHRAAHIDIPQYIIFSFFHCKHSVPAAYWLQQSSKYNHPLQPQCTSYFRHKVLCPCNSLWTLVSNLFATKTEMKATKICWNKININQDKIMRTRAHTTDWNGINQLRVSTSVWVHP